MVWGRGGHGCGDCPRQHLLVNGLVGEVTHRTPGCDGVTRALAAGLRRSQGEEILVPATDERDSSGAVTVDHGIGQPADNGHGDAAHLALDHIRGGRDLVRDRQNCCLHRPSARVRPTA